MEELDLINIWKTYDKKIEEARILNMQSWVLNLQWFESMQTQKAKTKMGLLANFKIVAVIFGILYILFLAILIYGNHLENIYFTTSVSLIMLITLIVSVVYIKHIVHIRQINYSKSITHTQEELSRLQSSTINIYRIAWLQLPLYTTWFWNTDWIVHDPVNFWLIAFPITLLFTILTIWLYRNISMKNMNKRWFKILFNTPEWKSVRKSMEFIREIEVFKQDLSF
jgi:hypothetical protein